VLFVITCSIAADAATYTFTPYGNDLKDLAHANYYIWGINWTRPANEVITGATLTYLQIWDWTVETDHLYTHLLDTVVDPNGPGTAPNWRNMSGYQTITIKRTDNQGGGDNFAGQGVMLGDWNDPKGGSNGKYAVDLSYDIPADKFGWLADGNWGFGIDPDCHYYNCGVRLVVTTRPQPCSMIPEWNTLLLSLVGLGGTGALRRVRRS
ncbi:MAG: hypothetical protein ACP5R5_10750, partial [Armatimonadota bacterium]